MIKLDDNLLTELGLAALPAEEKRALLKQIYETLEMRVGTTLARQMSDAQLDEFEGFITRNDEQGALQWLEGNFPNYKDVVAQEFETLKGEVRQSAPQIMASVAAHQQQAAQMPQPAYDPYAQQQQYQQPMPQQYQQMPQQQPMPPAQPYYGAPVQQPMPQQMPPDQSQFEQAA
jgi:hypothetical protein